jgi:hypothetical protein
MKLNAWISDLSMNMALMSLTFAINDEELNGFGLERKCSLRNYSSFAQSKSRVLKIFSGYVERNVYLDLNTRKFKVQDVPDIAEDKFIEMISNVVIESEFSTLSITQFYLYCGSHVLLHDVALCIQLKYMQQ